MQAGYQVVAINELLALGLANLGGAICGAVPTQCPGHSSSPFLYLFSIK